MRKLFQLILLLMMVGGMMTSCYYDNEEELYPTGQICDTTEITFSGDILSMADNFCQSCHSGATPSGNLNLETYDQISAAAEKMYERISKPVGDPQLMPPGQKLDDCTIKKLKIWIEEGKPNN
ncbi:MAG: hypothetical protein K9G58_06370 [Bacteroidales bacterium]|nr:hypothetical protein [Bacteroidales bacterium]MCF8386560.1 hypothetical protein [Bacteroidales bacterium]MCF8397773.1 hypothetical protein [Bacteroidales bacterium]